MLPSPPVHTRNQRSNTRKAIVLVVFLVLILPLYVAAQGSGRSTTGTGGKHIVQGYVFFPSGRRAEGPILIKLQSYTSGELSVVADSGGSFIFSNLAPGTYTVIIDAGQNYELARETVMIDSDISSGRLGVPQPNTSRRYTVMAHLKLKEDPNRAKPGVINAALAQVPEDARKLYEKGVEYSKGGDAVKAVESLKSAVDLYPNFPIALNELGVQYLKLGKPEKAVGVLRNAVKLDPEGFSPKLNLGIALLETKQYTQAQERLTEAVQKNSSSPIPKMYLGLTYAQLGNFENAEKQLLEAIGMGGNYVGLAHYYLGGLYWKKRDYPKAVEQLEKYLQLTPNATDADRVRTTIKDLRSRIQ